MSDAIRILHANFAEQNLQSYSALISEASVRASIKRGLRMQETAIANRVAAAESTEAKTKAARELKKLQQTIRPVYNTLVRTGEWPKDAFFYYVKPATPFSGFAVNLHITLPKRSQTARPGQVSATGFSVPIIRVAYGE